MDKSVEDTVSELVRQAASCGESPTIEQIDSMLSLISILPRDRTDFGIMDSLLDMRFALAGVSQ